MIFGQEWASRFSAYIFTIQTATLITSRVVLLHPRVAKLVVCNPRKNALLTYGNKSDLLPMPKAARF